jgi:hypothetical protein
MEQVSLKREELGLDPCSLSRHRFNADKITAQVTYNTAHSREWRAQRSIHNKDSGYPSRHGYPWSRSEDKSLISRVNNGEMDLDYIAKCHKRSMGGIASRISYLKIEI